MSLSSLSIINKSTYLNEHENPVVLVFEMHFHSALIVASLISTGCTMVTLRNPRQYPEGELTEQWLDHQKLDHFDPTNPSTWRQRYFVNNEWFTTDSGPIFLFVDGEGALDQTWLKYGSMVDSASQYNALCFGLEHRFYGKSHPKPDLTVGNLRYLSSEQALADVAYFVNNMNTKYNLTSNNKWVVFGGSYAGALVAWARMKYPHLIYAAVSSSGPVLAKASMEFGKFALQIFSLSSELCADNVHQAALKVADLLNQTGGAEILTKTFNLCEPIDVKDPDDVYLFTDIIIYSIWGQFQNFGISAVQSICETMTDGQGDLLERYANATGFETNGCNDIGTFNQSLSIYENTSYVELEGGFGPRQWFYQTCTEFGFYATASSRRGFFGSDLNLQFYIDTCKDIFGEQFNLELLNEGIKRTNTMYGGLDIEVTRVVFVQGSIDPWSTLGVRTSKPDAPAIVINGTTHCQNMDPPFPDDPQALTDARKEINDLIGRWLSVMTCA